MKASLLLGWKREPKTCLNSPKSDSFILPTALERGNSRAPEACACTGWEARQSGGRHGWLFDGFCGGRPDNRRGRWSGKEKKGICMREVVVVVVVVVLVEMCRRGGGRVTFFLDRASSSCRCRVTSVSGRHKLPGPAAAAAVATAATAILVVLI